MEEYTVNLGYLLGILADDSGVPAAERYTAEEIAKAIATGRAELGILSGATGNFLYLRVWGDGE